MIDISSKISTLRTAKALAIVKFSKPTYKLIKQNKLLKGNLFEICRASTTLAVKRVWEILPFCHNIPVDAVKVDYELNETELVVYVNVKSIAKTGCEMEALFGAAVCALNAYDMLKPHDKNIEISGIKLIEKKGGKSDFINEPPPGLKAAVLVISDSVSRKEKEDKSGKYILEKLKEYGVSKPEYKIVPDESELIKNAVKNWIDKNFDLILTTGGTGLSPRDTTPEAIKPLIEKEIPGIMEAARNYGFDRTPYSMLSRGIAGVTKNSLIITLPGSRRGVEESISAIFPYVFHVYKVMRMKPH